MWNSRCSSQENPARVKPRSRGCIGWNSTASASAIRTNFPVARCSAWLSLARWPIPRAFCWPMNPPAISTPAPAPSFSIYFCGSPANERPPRSWPRTTPKLLQLPTRWWSCAMAESPKSRGADMVRLELFYRLMVRPLLQEPVRLALMVLAVALGVAVVLAIDLAGSAAAGSFHSSMETLSGDNDLEIVASGGVPESILATLATQPFPLRLSPRMEDFAVDLRTQETLPLIGLDLIAEGRRYATRRSTLQDTSLEKLTGEESAGMLEDPQSIWVSAGLGKKPGEHLSFLINDQVRDCIVRGVFPDISANGHAVLMDIAGAQRALNRFGRVDRILLKLPPDGNLDEWQERLRGVLPAGIEVRPQGTGTEENRKMLEAFRWNLRLLSYIALVVGAFLIYNTISVSVVRRRNEIGIVRALGASRGDVLSAFLGEASSLGLAGGLLGLPLGRIMADGAVKLMALTVGSLYVSSRPYAIEVTPFSVALALAI